MVEKSRGEEEKEERVDVKLFVCFVFVDGWFIPS